MRAKPRSPGTLSPVCARAAAEYVLLQLVQPNVGVLPGFNHFYEHVVIVLVSLSSTKDLDFLEATNDLGNRSIGSTIPWQRGRWQEASCISLL